MKKSKKKAKRIIYRVQWVSKCGRRAVSDSKQVTGLTLVWRSILKAEAVAKARRFAKDDWKHGKPSKVVIYGKNGKIQKEWTYGKDPRRSRG